MKRGHRLGADRAHLVRLLTVAVLLALLGASCADDPDAARVPREDPVPSGPGDEATPDEDATDAVVPDPERRPEPPASTGPDEITEPPPPTDPPDEQPTLEPEPEPDPDDALAAERARLQEAQHLLTELGHPAGPVDGLDGPLTRRGLCTWRRLTGQEVNLDGLQPRELERLRDTRHPMPAPDGRGVTVDKTCQAVYLREGGTWSQVHHASTGEGGLPRTGDYTISRKRAGWHTSSLYPAPEPNMYNSMYFHGAIAIHGSNHVPPHPASAGCVRVTPSAADLLFARLSVGDPVTVIGQR